jgi:murein L,D-transpeptidase YcbB/YkuD
MIRYKASLKLLSLATIILITSSCKRDVDFEEFGTGIRQTFTAKDSSKKNIRNTPANVYAIYSGNGFTPVWITEEGRIKKADEFIKELESLPGEGISNAKYNLAELKAQAEAMSKNKNRKDIQAVIEWDKKMTTAYVQAANDLLYGVIDPEDAVDMWYHDNDSTVNWQEDIQDNKFPSLDVYRSKLGTYAALVKHRASLADDDSAKASVDANLERLRWLPQSFEEDYILTVVPMMEIMLKEKGKTTIQMKAVVGKPDRETPSLNADIVNIVFNPSWGVPPGIMKKDVIPGLLNKGTGYLDKKNLKVYDRKGNEIDPSTITADNYKGYVFRQPPSEKNALGQVKLNMPNPWDIYLHDTPSKGDFELEERYKSSGCVRLERALPLAEYILKKMNSNNDTLQIDNVLNAGETKYIKLQNRLPVHIVYLTAYDIDGQLLFFKDIYSKDRELAALLNKQN